MDHHWQIPKSCRFGPIDPLAGGDERLQIHNRQSRHRRFNTPFTSL
jgi:hypothetical protein